MSITKTAFVLIGTVIAGVAATSVIVSTSHAAPGDLDFTQIGTHPQATSQPTERGRTIRDIHIVGGKVYMGYGDYDANTGPIDINPFDLSTEAFDGSVLNVPTEELAAFRAIGNKLYAPMTDPRLPWSSNVGYAEMSEGGTWSNQFKFPAVHVFDMATLDGNDLWAVGSAEQPGGHIAATAYRSVDGGATWQITMTDVSSPVESGSGLERYYWLAPLNGKMYIYARDVSPSSSIRVFDGSSWTTSGSSDPCTAIEPNKVVVFEGALVCSYLGSLRSFDGTTSNILEPPVSLTVVRDFYTHDGFLYLLADNTIVRTDDLVTWQVLGDTPPRASAIAIDGDYVYIGTQDSDLLKSTITVDEAVAPSGGPSVQENCYNFDDANNTIVRYYQHENNNPANPACAKKVVIPSEIRGTSVTIIGSAAFDNLQLTAVTIPDSVTSIGNYAFRRNQLQYVDLGHGVQSIGHRAFQYNMLESIQLPDSVTSIGDKAFAYQMDVSGWDGNWADVVSDFYSSDDGEVQAVLDGIFYTRVYTESVANPNNLLSVVDTDLSLRGRENVGGHIINPATLTVRYVDEDNMNLLEPRVEIGRDGDVPVTSYRVSQGPSMIELADPFNPTAEENQLIQQILDSYYRIGDTVTINPPTIDGYPTPATRTVVLGAQSVDYVVEYVNTASSEVSPEFVSSESEDGRLANTGQDREAIIAVIASLFFASILTTVGIKLHARV